MNYIASINVMDAHDPVDLSDRQTNSERQGGTSSIEDRNSSKQVSEIREDRIAYQCFLDMISCVSKACL